MILKTHYVAIHRVQRRLGAALPIVWLGTLLELGGGTVGAVVGGVTGVAWGWLAALCVEGLVVSKEVVRGLRPDRMAGPPPIEARDEPVALAAPDAPTLGRVSR